MSVPYQMKKNTCIEWILNASRCVVSFLISSLFGQPRSASSLLSLKDIVDKGELTVSLKYQILTNKVTVVIMKAMNLPNISKIFAIGEFCLRIFFSFLSHT